MASSHRRRRTPDLPTIGGAVAAVAVAVFVLLLPAWRLEAAVADLGLHATMLGSNARAMLAAISATATGAFTWAVLFLLWGPGGFLARVTEGPAVPPVAERVWPDDLDQPLAAFDPTSILVEPMQPVRALPSLTGMPRTA